MHLDAVRDLLQQQAGVISRGQLRAAGATDHDLERWLRRRDLVRVHPRVYLSHTGQPSWLQRAWASVLWAEPAALSHGSAVLLGDVERQRRERDDEPVHVAVARHRRLRPVTGVVVHRTDHLAERVVDLAPPRIRLEHALLDLAAAARTDLDAVAVLADACGERRTTAERLLEHAAGRERLPRRSRVLAVLGDAAAGTCSALEQAYLDLVVRPHGLPPGRRQVSHRHDGDQRYRDVVVDEHALCVELDGRLHHESSTARDQDMERDLDAVAGEELLTVRLSWGQVSDRSCRTAERLGLLLRRRGWAGDVRRCGSCAQAA